MEVATAGAEGVVLAEAEVVTAVAASAVAADMSAVAGWAAAVASERTPHEVAPASTAHADSVAMAAAE